MQCRYHPKRVAGFFCASCNVGLCKECAEEVRPGQYYCFECAMLHSVSEVGASLKEKREEAESITSLGLMHGYGEMTDKDGDKYYSSMKGKRQKGEF